jgi:cysteinyl-tRNA synthetase
MLKIYNTLGKKLEDFKPLAEGHVKIYVCGPTVYNLLHVGNFRGPVFFNFVRNWLEHLGYKVDYALNFTDVDDKIINKANEEKKTALEVSEHYITEYKKDFASLGLRQHDRNPKVTEYIPEIISMISDIVEAKKAYASPGAQSGSSDVNFSISDFTGYGKLSGRNPGELQAGVRIDVNEKKRNPLDFALWKSAKPSEVAWPSPWGPGRPGWHIECSAMIKALYGDQIDIHGGGLDLMFPHHENEIAQSEACHQHQEGYQFVKYWMHWNMIQFSGTKMSKSLGNVISLRDFLADHHPEIYKWMMLTPHYRSTAEFGEEPVHLAIAALARVYSALALSEFVTSLSADKKSDAKYAETLNEAWKQIEAALNNDFGTPAAFATMFEVIRQFNSQFRRGMKVSPEQAGKAVQFTDFIKKFGGLMSLFQESPAEFLVALDDKLLGKMNRQRGEIDQLVNERAQVREVKDFAKADELRKKLTDMGILVSDLPSGSFWEVAK